MGHRVRDGRDRRGWRASMARHRGSLLAVYSAFVVTTLVAFAVSPSRARVLSGFEALVDAWEARWTPRVEHGEELVASGQYEEAVDYLTWLDDRFPARDVRHARDRERERILHALGRAHAALDHRGRALAAFERAVAFDPLNIRNRLALAGAASRFGDDEVARREYRRVLDVRPSHLPSLGAVAAYRYDEGDYEGVVRAYERYLGAFVVHHLVVSVGASADTVPVAVDGTFRTVRATFGTPAREASLVTIRPGPFAMELRRLVLEEGVVPGRADRAARVAVTSGSWTVGDPWLESGTEAERFPVGETWGSRPGDPTLEIRPQSVPSRVSRVTVDVRLLKPVDATTWSLVEASYRNTLDFDGLAVARRRTFLVEAPDAAEDAIGPSGEGSASR